jgi:hypothetical protein
LQTAREQLNLAQQRSVQLVVLGTQQPAPIETKENEAGQRNGSAHARSNGHSSSRPACKVSERASRQRNKTSRSAAQQN